MNEATRHKLIWGWLRVFLGTAQILLASCSLILLIVIGVHWLTWTMMLLTLAATVTSRLLYHRRTASRWK